MQESGFTQDWIQAVLATRDFKQARSPMVRSLFLSLRVVAHWGEVALALAVEHSSQAGFMAETVVVNNVRAVARPERIRVEDRIFCVSR